MSSFSTSASGDPDLGASLGSLTWITCSLWGADLSSPSQRLVLDFITISLVMTALMECLLFV